MANSHPPSSTLRAPSYSDLLPTPSGLTPNTRSEAEAALAHNTIRQTDAAAPTTPLPADAANKWPVLPVAPEDSGTEEVEAKRMYRRYSTADQQGQAQGQGSASSNLSTSTNETDKSTFVPTVDGDVQTASPVPGAPGFPPPGQGVVPVNPGISTGQAEALKRVRPVGLSLGDLGRKQSWSQQDMRHVYSARLMGKGEDDAGYSSGAQGQQYGTG